MLGGGYRGVLTSRSTRIPGLVSVADIAPTALGEDGALGFEPRDDPLAALADLDRRIDDNNAWRSRTATWLVGADRRARRGLAARRSARGRPRPSSRTSCSAPPR